MARASETDDAAIVIDNGSYSIKAGLAGEEAPSQEIRSLKRRDGDALHSTAREATTTTNVATADDDGRVIVAGIVTDWDAMESKWQRVFVGVTGVETANEHPILITETPVNPRQAKEKMAEILFEKFEAPAL